MTLASGFRECDLPPLLAAPRVFGVVGWLVAVVLFALISLLAFVVSAYCGYIEAVGGVAIVAAIVLTARVRGRWVLPAGVGLLAALYLWQTPLGFDWRQAGVLAVIVPALLLARAARPELLERVPTGWWLAALIAFALTLRVAAVASVPYVPCADFACYHNHGVDMARVWQYGGAGTRWSTYRCFYPPGQVFTLGLIYKAYTVITGQPLYYAHHVEARYAAMWAGMFNALLSAATVAGIWYLATQLFGRTVGRVAGVLAAVLPSTIFGCIIIGAEVPEAFWLVLAACLYVAGVERRGAWRAALACGVCLGIGTLIRPQFALLPVVLAGLMFLSWGKGRRWQAIKLGVVITIGTAACVLPWTVRNRCATGAWIPISSNGGGVLYSACNDDAKASKGQWCGPAWDRLFKASPDDESLNRLGWAWGKQWIATHPREYLALMPTKFGHFWGSDNDPVWWPLAEPLSDYEYKPVFGDVGDGWRLVFLGGSTGFYVAMLVLGTAGLITWLPRLIADRTWVFVPAFMLYFTVLHLSFEAQNKYHYMLVPLMVMLTALASAAPAATPAAPPVRTGATSADPSRSC